MNQAQNKIYEPNIVSALNTHTNFYCLFLNQRNINGVNSIYIVLAIITNVEIKYIGALCILCENIMECYVTFLFKRIYASTESAIQDNQIIPNRYRGNAV